MAKEKYTKGLIYVSSMLAFLGKNLFFVVS